jgi:hypothetical protein
MQVPLRWYRDLTGVRWELRRVMTSVVRTVALLTVVTTPRVDTAFGATQRATPPQLKAVVAATFQRFLDAYSRHDIAGVLSTLAFSDPRLKFNYHDCDYTGVPGSRVTSEAGMRSWLRDRFAENDRFTDIQVGQDGDDLAIGMGATRVNDILWARKRSVALGSKSAAIPDGTKFYKVVLETCDKVPRLVTASAEKSRATVEAFVDAVSANDPAYVERLLGRSVQYDGCDTSGTRRVHRSGKVQTMARIRTLMREGWQYTVTSLHAMRQHGRYLVSATVQAGNANATGRSALEGASPAGTLCSASGPLVLRFGLSADGWQIRRIDATAGCC